MTGRWPWVLGLYHLWRYSDWSRSGSGQGQPQRWERIGGYEAWQQDAKNGTTRSTQNGAHDVTLFLINDFSPRKETGVLGLHSALLRKAPCQAPAAVLCTTAVHNELSHRCPRGMLGCCGKRGLDLFSRIALAGLDRLPAHCAPCPCAQSQPPAGFYCLGPYLLAARIFLHRLKSCSWPTALKLRVAISIKRECDSCRGAYTAESTMRE